MNDLYKKKSFLINNSFIEIFENGVFINRELKLLFTTEAIEDSNLNEIEKIIKNRETENNPAMVWIFYFSYKPEEETVKKILHKLEIPKCIIHIIETNQTIPFPQ